MIATPGVTLVRALLGEAGDRAIATLDLDRELAGSGAPAGQADRLAIAAAMNVALFAGLVDRVPSAAAYVAEQRAAGSRIRFDHGALRTVRFPAGPTGALPEGEEAFTRFFLPLGYRHVGTYPLPRLRMTGRAYAHDDAPTTMPQFFLSELHVDQFDAAFGAAAQRVFGASRDPLSGATLAALDRLGAGETLAIDDAAGVLRDLVSAFGRQHPAPSVADYETLLAQSAEAAWLSTEGNAFNHATDRVADLDALVAAERAAGRPIKDSVEVSASGRVRQTAHRAATVTRDFVGADGAAVTREVPGSFYEFIARDIDPETGEIDLRFDSGNATGIFGMTRAA